MASGFPPDVVARSANYPLPQYNPNRRIICRHAPVAPQDVGQTTRSQVTSPVSGTDETSTQSGHFLPYGGHIVSRDVPMVTSPTPANQQPAFSQPPLQPIYTSIHQLHHCPGCRCGYDHPQNAVLLTRQITRPCRPPDYTMLGIVTCIFCNICLGTAAIVLAILSNQDAESGNTKAATSKSKISLILSVIGIFCGVVTIVCVISFVIIAYH